MSRACTSRFALLAMLVLGGCFTEAGIEPGPEGSTGGPSCIDGAVGCACYRNETCDPGLACEVELDRCIPEDCTPGQTACVCDGGECDTPSECNSGICEVPGAGDGGGDDGDGDGGPSTMSATGSDDGPSATSSGVDDTGDDGSTSGPATSTGVEPETGDSGGPTCDEEGDCGACFACADKPEGGCEGALQACSRVTGCMTAAMCLTDCGLTGFCFEDCCAGLGPAQLDAVNALMFCRTDHCTSSCARLEIPVCD